MLFIVKYSCYLGGDRVDISNIWNLFLEKVKDSLDPILYETWFMDTKLIDLNESSAKVLVPMQVHKKHLKENL